MKNYLYISFILISTVIPNLDLRAQTPTDAIMMQKGQICFAASYTNATWDEYWEGTLKRSNGNIGTLTRETYMPMFALGLTDRINLLAAMPYVKTEPSGGQMKGVSSFQDFSIWLKATAFQTFTNSGYLSFHPVVGLSLPTSDYLEDYVPFSVGLGCPDVTLRGILQYRFDIGVYVRGQAAYMVRGNSTIERDYYYTTHGVYSDEVDMPNALNWGATLGSWFLNNKLKVEATYDGLNTYGGFDIRRQDMGFPSNKMIFTRVGGGAHYYDLLIQGLGVFGEYNTILTGRNIGQTTSYTLGLTYQFGLWNTNEEPVETE